MPDWLSTDQMLVIAETYGVPMVGAILVLIIGWTLSSMSSPTASRACSPGPGGSTKRCGCSSAA